MIEESLIGGRYLLHEVVGSGGAALVFRATDMQTQQLCALKILHDERPVIFSHVKQRLEEEGAVLAHLQHTYIIGLLDSGVHDGRPYLVLEWAGGGTLAQKLGATGPMSPQLAVSLTMEVLEALQVAHEADVVHRDVKPSNILLTDTGQVRLSDFGIAKHDQGALELTKTGIAMGSLAYMSPEQRVDARRAGPATDQYAAAAMLFHLVTGSTPVDLYLSPAHSPRFEGLPDALTTRIRKAVSADVDQRYASVADFSSALGEILLELPSEPILLSPVPQSGQFTADPAPVRMTTVDAKVTPRVAPSGRARDRLIVVMSLVLIPISAYLCFGLGVVIQNVAESRSLLPSLDVMSPANGQLGGLWTGHMGEDKVVMDLRDTPEGVFAAGEFIHDGSRILFRLSGQRKDGVLRLKDTSQGPWGAGGEWTLYIRSSRQLDGHWTSRTQQRATSVYLLRDE